MKIRCSEVLKGVNRPAFVQLGLGVCVLVSLGIGMSVLAQEVPRPVSPTPESSQPVAVQMPAAGVPGQTGLDKGEPWHNWQELYYRPFRIPKKDAILLSNGLVQPTVYMPGYYVQIVVDEGDEVVVKNLPLEDPRSYMHRSWKRDINDELVQLKRAELEAKAIRYELYDLPDLPPPSVQALDFDVSQEGLPISGLWQTSFDIADVNGDGTLDLILPPARKGAPFPAFALGDGKGGFKQWADARWPEGIKLDYGTVRAADLDSDGNIDIVAACHLGNSYVLYGNGKGDFTRYTQLPLVGGWYSKAATIADFDQDGRLDVALLSELDAEFGKFALPGPMVNVVLNKPGGWVTANEGLPESVFGDGIVATDINMDGYPDLVITCHNGGFRDNVQLNPGKGGGKWHSVARLQMPWDAFAYSVAAGNVCLKKGAPDVLFCFEQVNQSNPEKPVHACVLYHFHDKRGKYIEKPEPQVICKDSENAYYLSATMGDVDGDGRLDLVMARSNGVMRLFLQPQPGVFREQAPVPLQKENIALYSVRVADIDGDGKGEIITMGSGDQGGVLVIHPKDKVNIQAGKAK